MLYLTKGVIFIAVTIKEIAKLAGVSSGTVDRAIHEREGVNPQVAQRIREIAQKLDYKPNQLAKGLANTHKSFTVGAIVNSGGNEFFDDVLDGIKKANKQYANYGLDLITIVLKGYDANEQVIQIEKLVSKGIKALLITPIDDKIVIDKLNELSKMDIAVVTLNSDVYDIEKICFIGCDYYNSGQIAGELMSMITDTGATLAVVAGSDLMLGHRLRIAGFTDSLVQKGYSNKNIQIIYNDDDEIKSYTATKKLLQEQPHVHGIYFCAGGTLGGIKAVNEFISTAKPQNKINIITVDRTDAVRNNIKNGMVTATITQQPFEQGFNGVKVIFDYLFLKKEPNSKNLYTKNEIIIKSNLY